MEVTKGEGCVMVSFSHKEDRREGQAERMGLGMDEIRTQCPKCGCPHWSTSGFRTADAPVAWRDDDGSWYFGPSIDEQKRSCASCGWAQKIVRKRGKLHSVESDAT